MLFNGIEHGRLNFRVGPKSTLADAAWAHRAIEVRETTEKFILAAWLALLARFATNGQSKRPETIVN